MEDSKNKEQEPNENPEVSEEEKSLEEEALKETEDDEVRSKVVEDLGLDENEDTELIDKIVAGKTEEQKKLSTAIKQKRSWRDKAQAPKEQKEEVKPPQPSGQITKEELLKEVDTKVDERLRKQELDSLELSDELKEEVKSLAELKKMSVKEVLDSPYIQFRKQEEEKLEQNDKASIGSKHRTGAKLDYKDMKPTDFDMSTEEGRKDFHEYEKILKEKLG